MVTLLVNEFVKITVKELVWALVTTCIVRTSCILLNNPFEMMGPFVADSPFVSINVSIVLVKALENTKLVEMEILQLVEMESVATNKPLLVIV